MDCDIHIGIGCLVPHPVMGWGGGGKILYPGIAGEETVAYFHLKASLHDENMFGLDTTPIRDMMENWVDAIGLDFIINVVLNAKQQIADVVAGHYVLAHRAGVQKGKRISGCRVTEKADVVIVSSHPADQDFWQSPKAMYAAERALKGESGGTMILVSPNYEGVGPHPEYPELMGKDGAYYGPRISQIIERYLGKGHKIADATLDQVELISLIVTDVREDLFKQK
jgi:nickel-dependent lactate racemase